MVSDELQEMLSAILREEAELSRICYISGKSINIQIPDHGDYYSIAFSSCDTPARILRWVYLLSQKNWYTIALNRRFIELACDAHGLELSKLHN
jgi:hypothetical protein